MENLNAQVVGTILTNHSSEKKYSPAVTVFQDAPPKNLRMNRPFVLLFLAIPGFRLDRISRSAWIDRYDTPNSGYSLTGPPGGPLGLYLCPENPKGSGNVLRQNPGSALPNLKTGVRGGIRGFVGLKTGGHVRLS